VTITAEIHQAALRVLPSAGLPPPSPAVRVRDGAWVAELTGNVLLGRPDGMRLIIRKERPVRREALLIRTEVGDLRR
jgi:hypothetical protein